MIRFLLALLAVMGVACILLAEAAFGQVPCSVQSVTDGDTFRAHCRPWPGIVIETAVRVKNIDAPEMKAKCAFEALQAGHAKAALGDLLKLGPVLLYDVTPDKFSGRVDANVLAGGVDVGVEMIVLGHARAYLGGKREPWC
jgi:endonuclease YncB( thermonuclease family)